MPLGVAIGIVASASPARASAFERRALKAGAPVSAVAVAGLGSDGHAAALVLLGSRMVVMQAPSWTPVTLSGPAAVKARNQLARGLDGTPEGVTIASHAPAARGSIRQIPCIATVDRAAKGALAIYDQPTLPPDANRYPTRVGTPVAHAAWPRRINGPTHVGVKALAFADLDRDGSDELVVAAAGQPLTIWRQTLTDEWEKAAIVEAGSVDTLAAGDLDADGAPDLLVVSPRGELSALFNRMAPVWVRHVVTTGFPNETALAADFTGDGRPDVITADQDHHRILLYAAPDWTPTTLREGLYALHGDAFDVDGDGDLDYVGGQYRPGIVYWLERPRDPLRAPWPLHVIDAGASGGPEGVHSIVATDLDGDGHLEVLVNSNAPEGPLKDSLLYYRVPRDPRAATPWPRTLISDKEARGFSHYFGVADMNGDGRADVLQAAKAGAWFAWWEQPARADASWKKRVVAEDQAGASNILAGDFNGDGALDLLASRGHGRGLVYFAGPAFQPRELLMTLVGPHTLAVGDLDGDGDLDAMTCAKDVGIVAWLENDGKAQFTAHTVHEAQSGYDLRLVDIDGDGDRDALLAGQESRNVVWFENRLRATPTNLQSQAKTPDPRSVP